jgi:vacuolar-type H+-ATPase subunit E/Vma4
VGLAELVTRLERDAEARVAEIDARARDDTAAIAAESERAAAQAREGALAARRQERQRRLDRELAEARGAARARRLLAEHAVVARVLARARAMLDDPACDEAYRSSLRSAIARALAYFEGDVVVRCAPALADDARRALVERAGARVDASSAHRAGFVMASADGSMSVDETLAARLGRTWAACAVVIVAEASK